MAIAYMAMPIKLGFESDLHVMNATIDMYAKCGCIGHAEKLFETEFVKDEISWNTMIAGYAQNGQPKDAVSIFCWMREKEELQPNLVSIVSIIPAYAQLAALNEGKTIHSYIVKTGHEGLVDEGLRIFESMRYENYIEPNLEHHACMVDLLGRAGKIEEAWTFIQRMPMKPDAGVWGALLGACRIHLNVEWDDAHKMRMVMHSKRLKKFLVAVGLEEKIATRNHDPLQKYSVSKTLASGVEPWAMAQVTKNICPCRNCYIEMHFMNHDV
ncbi:pentatricopeptide repeat-containing protein At2g01510, mitochondrial-like [Amborella trichopoda]|uniref:pentatricopeptide repeat-containing protein At2g01510, mitochondrial-like n=1 Tax=Amborella trichopoda TaxID=13333 RepID=UPI0009BFC9A3|nr:pentatricopeptide repeat-containing protein At2g01510, mitochondrial-like [Amborella trichopoda]|eukprot:XP_020525031.1 pentatricopeptide repeat-containing protein At2g01510, mitochondrial-like [Amborella trichopoda]